MSQAAAELFREEAPERPGRRRPGRHRWRLRALLRRRDRHLRRLAPDRRGGVALCDEAGIEYTELQVAVDALTVVVHPDLDGRLPDHRAAHRAVGAGLEGQQLEPARPELPRPGDRAVRAGHRLRHLRLHGRRRDRRRVRDRTRDDYEASEDDNVLVQGVAGTEGATGYFGYTYYEENADILKALRSTTATAASSPRRRPRRPASTRRCLVRCSSTSPTPTTPTMRR